ncbi:MAG: hypothetical protein ABIZ36_06920, partial [Gemmatimonadaceae bacterium]
MNASSGASPLTVGAELELIPVHVETRLPVPIQSPTSACSSDILRRVAAKQRWCETLNGIDPSSWVSASGATISFEPGGQIEVSSSPHASVTALVQELSEMTGTLLDTFERFGVILETKGVDPYNSISET